MLQVAAFFLKTVDEFQNFVRGVLFDGGNKFAERFFRHNTEKFADGCICNFRAAICASLFEKR